MPLALGDVTVRSATAGASVLELTGIWEFDGLMQTDYPLSVLVTAGDEFVRYPIGEPARGGMLGGLDDGLQLDEIPALEAAGRAEPTARVLSVDEHRISISLPEGFPGGLVSVMLYRTLDAERFGIPRHEVRPASFSNTVVAHNGAAS